MGDAESQVVRAFLADGASEGTDSSQPQSTLAIDDSVQDTNRAGSGNLQYKSWLATDNAVTEGSHNVRNMEDEVVGIEPEAPVMVTGSLNPQPSLVSDEAFQVAEKGPSVPDRNESSTPNTTTTTSDLDDDKEKTADEQEYLTGWRLVVMAIAPCLNMFAVCLDNTVISTAIPTITAEFNTISDIGWYGSAYLLTAASTQILYGKIYFLYSAKWVTLAALAIFELGSLVCASAPNSDVLIVGRALAGPGASGLLTGAVIVAGSVVPLNKRPILVGIVSALNGVAAIAGPLLGGFFTQHLTWRWAFYINLPIGALAAVITVFFYNPKTKVASAGLTLKQQLLQLDLEGLALFIPSIVCLLLALQWGGNKWRWSDGRIVSLLAAFAALAAAYVGVQFWKKDKATLPPRLMKNQSIATCLLCIACISGAFYTVIYYLPIWFQVVRGATALSSGIMTLPMLISMIVMSIISGGLVSLVGFYTPFLMVGTALICIGAGLMSTLHLGSANGEWIGYQILFGAGLGVATQQPLIAMQASLPKADVPIGNAIMFFGQTLGGSCFLTAAQIIFTDQLVKGVEALHVDGLNASTISGVGATTFRDFIPQADMAAFLGAYSAAITHTFYLAAGLAGSATLVSVIVPWNSIKGKDLQLGAVAG